MLVRAEAGEQPIYTMDIETDPFERNKVPVPFVIGFYDGMTFWRFWTDKQSTCIEKMRNFLEDETVDPGIVYMHNGGRFDFFYLLDWFEGKTTIIGSRIVEAKMPLEPASRKTRFDKWHCFAFRDSYAIMPFPLRSYQKESLDIEALKPENRHAKAAEIEFYLRGDCVYLWELCMGFQREFGDFKTIASAAFHQLSQIHKYDQLSHGQDAELRSRFYYGGRVQCFEKGIVKGPVQIYDANSMYPFVMANYLHPVSWPQTIERKLHGWDVARGQASKEKLKTFFIEVQGKNDGAFPTRAGDGSVDFTQTEGRFFVTVHEYLEACRLRLFKTEAIITTYNYTEYSFFHQFVDQFYQARKKVTAEFNAHKEQCSRCGAKSSISATEGSAGYCPTGADLVAHNLYYKYILNSAYGKFGLNPENYFDWQITKQPDPPPKGEGWTLDMLMHGKFFVWKKPSAFGRNLKNIGTAASITGAARSYLMRAIARSKGVLYCDTDSILCSSFGSSRDLPVDGKQLGAWKPEGSGLLTAIAGKKMYAVFGKDGECIKHANKGVQLTPEQIFSIAKGDDVFTWEADAPTFKRDGSAIFQKRRAKNTVGNVGPAPHVAEDYGDLVGGMFQ
jgi:DNA polymerase elongation subunit (family B)